jgi:glutamate-1-semialdehyde 2,1-aminomutase
MTISADQKLRQRAQQVIPGGMYGHLRSDRLPEGYPQFFERGEGCHLWDVNGKRYVDFMCSWGLSLLKTPKSPVPAEYYIRAYS